MNVIVLYTYSARMKLHLFISLFRGGVPFSTHRVLLWLPYKPTPVFDRDKDDSVLYKIYTWPLSSLFSDSGCLNHIPNSPDEYQSLGQLVSLSVHPFIHSRISST